MDAMTGCAVAIEPTRWQKFQERIYPATRWWYEWMAKHRKSNLETFAENELRIAGFYSEDSDYGGMIPEAVLAIVKVFGRQGHSGGSAWVVRGLLAKLLAFKPLTALTDDPSEWMSVSEYYGPKSKPIWQNRRDSACFSEDGGKTYYSIDDPARKFKMASSRGVK